MKELGKKSPKTRSKAHPDNYPDQGPVSLVAAYDDLTPSAFAVWMRLMGEPPEVLRSGRRRISALLGFTERHCNEILKQLRRKGYVDFLNRSRGYRGEIIIQRRCLINSRFGFVRLGNFLGASEPEGARVQTIYLAMESGEGVMLNVLSHDDFPPDEEASLVRASRHKFVDEFRYADDPEYGVDLAVSELDSVVQPLASITNDSAFKDALSEGLESVGFAVSRNVPANYKLVNGNLRKGHIDITAKKMGVLLAIEVDSNSPRLKSIGKLQKFLCSSKVLVLRGVNPEDWPKPPPGLDKLICVAPTSKGTIGVKISRLREAREKIERSRSVERSETHTRRLRLAKQAGRRPGQINWDSLDQLGHPKISFDPGHELRRKVIAALKLPANNLLRRRVVEKIGTEFSRIYERYRRSLERSAGHSGTYVVQERETKLCEEAGIQCIQKGITPRQLLEYWDGRVRDFTDGDLKIPSLNFLKSASNVDRVVCSTMGSVRPEAPTKLRATDRNTFSVANGIDVRLRPALHRAGFDTTAFNDRYLLSIQHNAVAIAEGKHILLPDGAVRKMIIWAAENLYGVSSAAS